MRCNQVIVGMSCNGFKICKVNVLIIKKYYRSPHGSIVFLAISIRTLCSQKPKKKRSRQKKQTNKKLCPAVRKFSIYNHAFILTPFQLLRTNQKQANLYAIQANLYVIQANQNAIQANWIQSTVKPALGTNSSK